MTPKEKRAAEQAKRAEKAQKAAEAKAARKDMPNRMEDVDAEYKAAVAAKEAELGRETVLDERVELMQDLMGREITPSEVVKLAKRIAIMIHKSDKKDAVDPVPLSVNGYTITVERGKVVQIPEHFLEVLENAVETHFTFHEDKNDKSILHKEERDAPSYPFTLNPRVTQRGERTH